MPLPDSVARREIHHRVIDMKAYAREDGLYDIEAHLVDRKPYTFKRFSSPDPLPAGQPLHDLKVRLTVDEQFVVRHVHASSDITPYGVCKEAESTLAVLVGERIASGWSKRVKERLRGATSCTHLMEMLIPMATTAFQGIRSLDPEKSNRALDANGVPHKLDSCYAYSRERGVVMRLWPQHYAPREPANGET
jgi:hypothetical protein